MRFALLPIAAIGVILTATPIASSYPVGPPQTLDELAQQADVIFKGVAISSQPARDHHFEPCDGFVVRQTQFRVIAVIQGKLDGERVGFRHYDRDPQPSSMMYAPQNYQFEVGRSYLVFAKKTGTPGVLRQCWRDERLVADQGVLRCADDKPAIAGALREVFWRELTAMLSADKADDVRYAISHLDQLSNQNDVVPFGGVDEFPRERVLEVIRPLIRHSDDSVARSAITFLGSHNPYLDDEQAIYWLAAVGIPQPGIGALDRNRRNVGGEQYWQDLATTADNAASEATRAIAIRALGLVRNPSLVESLNRWLNSASPTIRAAATVLLADFPGAATHKRLEALADDTSPLVRACASHAAGYSQDHLLAPMLGRLLRDSEPKVRQAAAMSLLSFSAENEVVASSLRANLKQSEFAPLFLLALARNDVGSHLDALAEIACEKTRITNWWGGESPDLTAWCLIYQYLKHQPGDDLRGGRFDKQLDAMERLASYSSAEPASLYALYLLRGMNERAQRFRAAATKAAAYNLDRHFQMVDKAPANYLRAD